MWEECFQYDSSKHPGFLRVLRFPPVQTLDQWGRMTLTVPL